MSHCLPPRFCCRASTTNSTAKSRSTSLYNVKSLQQTLHHRRQTRHGRSPTLGALHLPVLPWPSVCLPNGWQVPLLLWHASRLRLACASARQPARRSDRGQLNSLGLNAQPGAPARAGARHGACNAQQCSPRLAQMRPSSQPTVHRLLKKHSDECGTGDAWQAGHDAVIGCCVPSE